MGSSFCQELQIPCTDGILEGRIQYREEGADRPGVILCPPHPLLAGNMDNNVIVALSEQLCRNFTVLSFNYRNVGGSFKADGDLPLFEYWDRLDRGNNFSDICYDVSQVLQWSRCCFRRFHLVGYSFGAYIAQSVLTADVLSLSSITPPLAEHTFTLDGVSCPSLVIFAEQDELLHGEKMSLPERTEVHKVGASDHFFLGKEEELCGIVESFLMKVS